MQWTNERKLLKISKDIEKRNSPLKKKLAIIKKLKNINKINTLELCTNLELENMDRFIGEIINAILSNEVNDHIDLRNIIKACFAINNSAFICLLMQDLVRMLKNDYSCNEVQYWHATFLLELKSIVDEQVCLTELSKQICSYINVPSKIYFLKYLIENFRSIEVEQFVKQQLPIPEDELCETFKNMLNLLHKSVGITVESKHNFKKLVTVDDNEFSNYNLHSKNVLAHSTGSELLQSNLLHPDISGFISHCKFSSHIRLCKYQIILSNIALSFSIAKQIASLGSISKKITNKFIEEIYSNKKAGMKCLGIVAILAELSKFNRFPVSEIFSILDHFYKYRCIRELCLCLELLGRFLLSNKEHNYRVRKYIEKMITYKNCATPLESIHINNMLCRVFKTVTEQIYNIKEFLKFYIQEDTYRRDSHIASILSKNKKFLCFILLHPWDFGDLKLLKVLAFENKMENLMVSLLLRGISLNLSGKQKLVFYIKFLAHLAYSMKKCEQIIICDKLLGAFDSTSKKAKSLLIFLRSSSMDLKRTYFFTAKKLVICAGSIYLENIWFNFCEENGFVYDDGNIEDSFEREFKALSLV